MKISLIGSGNVARVLGHSLTGAGYEIVAVCSRNGTTGRKLAKELHALYIKHPSEMTDASDLYIIAADDDAISAIAAQIPFVNKPVVHTSGSTHIDALKRFPSSGVFYPLNTFSGFSKTISGTPALLEARTKTLLTVLKKTAKAIHCRPSVIDSDDRMIIHLAAVLTNNFTNAMLAAAEQIVKEKNIDFSLLKPLAFQTIENAFKHGPVNVQTGPAKRGDAKTIRKHTEILKQYPDVLALYKSLSKLIVHQGRSVSA